MKSGSDMPQFTTVQSRALQKLFDAAAAHGVSAEELCKAAGLGGGLVRNPDERIAYAHLVSMYSTVSPGGTVPSFPP